jgi:hypothetical protein
MPWWTWLCLAILLAVGFAAAIVAVVLSLRAFGAIRQVQGELVPVLERLGADVDALAERAERAGARVEEVERRFAEVQRSTERLGVLKWALDDSLGAVTRLRQAVPRK